MQKYAYIMDGGAQIMDRGAQIMSVNAFSHKKYVPSCLKIIKIITFWCVIKVMRLKLWENGATPSRINFKALGGPEMY